VTLGVPAMGGLAGATITAQSLCLTLANNANLLTSNGAQGTIDAN
jgi:hypothetical protein